MRVRERFHCHKVSKQVSLARSECKVLLVLLLLLLLLLVVGGGGGGGFVVVGLSRLFCTSGVQVIY